jgi:hypothetical protein
MKKSPWNAWFDLAADSWRLGLEAQAVVGLRLAKLAAGDAAAAVEAQRMVTEKVLAAAEAQAKAMGDILSGQARHAPKRTVALYRRKVRANRGRLGRKRPSRKV